MCKNTDAWEQRKLGEVAPLRGGYAFKSADYCDEGVPIIRISNILADGTIGTDFVYYKEQQFDNEYLLENGAVLLAMSGATTGKVSILNTQNKAKYYQNQRVGYFPKNKKIDYRYIATILRSQQFINQLTSVLVAGAQPNVSSKDIDNFEFMISREKEEQTKIGNFFYNLDNLIALHQRKYDKLLNVKKALLDKMFPKNQEKTPKIRFKGFFDAWEQRKLGEVATYRRGSFPQPYGKKEWYDGKNSMPFVQVVDVTENMNLADITKQRISSLAQPMSIFAQKGSVLVTLQGSIGRVAITQYGAFIDRTILIFEQYKEKICKIFWGYTIKQKFIEEAKQAPGGTIKTITKEVLSNFKIYIPNIEEQNKIGNFFYNLDNLITLHQRKCEKLKNIKKALLDKMLV